MKKGEHILVSRIGYIHHGLYIGNDVVIHYSNRIKITSLKEFSKESKVHVGKHPNRKFSRKKSIKRAKSKLGEDSYNLIFNNCEHFVNWCIEGKKSSSQIKLLADTAILASNYYLKNKHNNLPPFATPGVASLSTGAIATGVGYTAKKFFDYFRG